MRGLYFVCININSLVPKIDELQNIAKLSKAAVIGISESKWMIQSYLLKFKLKITI